MSERKTWSVGDRVVRVDGPPMSPGGAGTVEGVAPEGNPHPVRVRWDAPQTEPGGTPHTSTLHWSSELAEAP